MQTVASFLSVPPALLAKGRLEAEGIPATLLNENLVSVNWMYSTAVGGVKVAVPAEDAERAREILATAYGDVMDDLDESKLAPESDEICPRCGGDGVGPRRISPWSFLPSILLSIPILFRRPGWQCSKCGATGWRRHVHATQK